METIRIGFRDVEIAPNFLGDNRHSFIEYTNSAGQVYLFSAFPEPKNDALPSVVDYLKDGDGQQDIKAQWVLNTKKAYDHKFVDDPATKWASVATGSDLSAAARVLEFIVGSINGSHIQYGYNSVAFTGNNSNSAVWTAISLAGLGPINVPDGVHAPGRQDDLSLNSLWDASIFEPQCFAEGTEVTMADGSTKPIEEITAGDWVLSHDKNGKSVPGRVTRTFTNEAKIILDFHGTFVTPGHVYYCAGGKYEGCFVPLIDILRDDGVIQHEDGTLIRATTGCEVGSKDDTPFWAYTAYEDADGNECVKDSKLLRLGTRWMLPNGHHFTMREFMEGNRIELLDDGRVRFKDTGLETLFMWTFSDTPPNPEDFVLSRSQTSLENIYEAGQWETMQPTMPMPLRRDSGPVQPASEYQFDAMPRNTPMAFENESLSSGLASHRPKMNRKQRKAQEAKMRASTKAAARRATVH